MPSLFHPGPEAAFSAAAMKAYQVLRDNGLTHTYVLHRRSSQAFALNLFAPLGAEGSSDLLSEVFGGAVQASEPVFEWSDAEDRLEEARPGSPHRTQVDVVLEGISVSGERVTAFVEVKLTESDFGTCSAYDNPANPALDVCRTTGIFGGQPERCFQLQNHGMGRRRYDDHVVEDEAGCRGGPDGGCTVRTGANQVMRNLALGASRLEQGQTDRLVYLLCAPRAHKTIWRRFTEAKSALDGTTVVTLGTLPAESVANCHGDGGKALRLRYRPPLLDDGPPAIGMGGAPP